MVYLTSLTWNRRNTFHVERHNVTPQEVAEVCFTNHYSRRVDGRNRFRRYVVIGQTEAGRHMTVFVDSKERYVLSSYCPGR